MGGQGSQDSVRRANKKRLRKLISRLVASAFPGCSAKFVGQQGHAAKVARTFGFRVWDESKQRHRSNIVWIDPDYTGSIDEGWIADAVGGSNR